MASAAPLLDGRRRRLGGALAKRPLIARDGCVPDSQGGSSLFKGGSEQGGKQYGLGTSQFVEAGGGGGGSLRTFNH